MTQHPMSPTARLARVLRRRTRFVAVLGLVAALFLPSGCGTLPIPPTYTIEELAAKCAREGGVWRSFVGEGYCEYQSPGFI